jgi:hypothetical protein
VTSDWPWCEPPVTRVLDEPDGGRGGADVLVVGAAAAADDPQVEPDLQRCVQLGQLGAMLAPAPRR